MRRIVVGLMSTVSAVVLLFSYHTSTNSPSSASSSDDDAVPADDPAPASSAESSSASSSAPSSASSSATYTGDPADTQWGVVQVEITVQDGKITKSEAIEYPTQNGRDQQINAYAIPELNAEAVQQQSGSIDAVSGATVTSGGYLQSLQSAIDKAHL